MLPQSSVTTKSANIQAAGHQSLKILLPAYRMSLVTENFAVCLWALLVTRNFATYLWSTISHQKFCHLPAGPY